MTDSNDVQTLEKISTELDESQVFIVLSIQCIKAQNYLINKLQKRSAQQKQTCYFISNGNLKLETEIELAKQEVKSLLGALETIKVANVELKKELLLAQDRTIATTERVTSGIKKYEQLWLTSKQRYENIPFIKKYLETINEKDTAYDNITKLAKEKQQILNDINKEINELFSLDRKNIIELARYMIHERPVTLKNIKNKQDELNKLINIQNVPHSNESATILKVDLTVDKNAPNITKNIQDSWLIMGKTVGNKTMVVPKLQLPSIDLDFFSNKLDKIKRSDSQKIPIKRIDSEPLDNQPKKIKTEEMLKEAYVSPFFSKNNEKSVDLKSNFAEKKLIHILKDIKLGETETFKIVAKVNCNELQIIDKIGGNVQEKIICPDQNINPGENEEKIKEIDCTNTPMTSNVLDPPSQFLDFSQNEMTSQGRILAEENITKKSQEKKVTFNEIMSVKSTDRIDLCKAMDEDDNNLLDVSAAGDENYKKIKEIVFKKYNLDSSPQFTYTKNVVTSMQSENIVKSNFFDNKIQSMAIDEKPAYVNIVESSQKISDDEIPPENINENKDGDQKHKVSGLLFTHGLQQGIIDSLDVSISTQGYEENDLPPSIDSSLLLSPKADDQMPTTSGAAKVTSQVPNFLSGLKKSGLSFFANQQSEDKCSTTQTPNSNFTFAFGGDGKKPKGGFFSMFN